MIFEAVGGVVKVVLVVAELCPQKIFVTAMVVDQQDSGHAILFIPVSRQARPN